MTILVTVDRSGRRLTGGAYLSSGLHLETGWHIHDMHQIQYAFEGMMEIEDEVARYVVPHQYAVWIPAGIRHRTRLQGGDSGSVFLRRDTIDTADTRMSVIRVAPLMREMILEAMRWPIMDGYNDPTGDSFFHTFALLCREWLKARADLVLPTCDDPRVNRIVDYTVAHLDSVSLDDVCSTLGMSERTLRRRFLAAMGLTWEEFRLRCRMIKAIELLEQENLPIVEIAGRVGYRSQSAFTKSFRQVFNDSPTAYRSRRFTPSGPFRQVPPAPEATPFTAS